MIQNEPSGGYAFQLVSEIGAQSISATIPIDAQAVVASSTVHTKPSRTAEPCLNDMLVYCTLGIGPSNDSARRADMCQH
jgi:hypothetical protein